MQDDSPYTAIIAEIMDTEPSDELIVLARRFISKAPYTTVALVALVTALEEIDPKTANVIVAMLDDVAQAEAKSI